MILKVEGAARLRRTFRKAGVDMRELKEANRRAARIVLTAATATAPVGPEEGGHIKTTGRVGATNSVGSVRFGGKAKPYGPPVHYGWHKGGIHYGNPWVTDAAQATESTWIQVYYRDLERVLSKIEGD